MPLFLTQLAETLRLEATATPFSRDAIGSSATRHGAESLAGGFSVSQVVHDYGDICQAITEIALGAVALRAHADGQRLVVEIEDECGGIPASKADRFQAFGDRRGTDRSGLGLGLGLSIARQAVRAHGGNITIRNMPGRGCIFAIDVPLAAAVVSVPQFTSRSITTSPRGACLSSLGHHPLDMGQRVGCVMWSRSEQQVTDPIDISLRLSRPLNN